MNRASDMDNIHNFSKMCSQGSICPLNNIEFRNKTGDRIYQKPFMDHAITLCNNNNTNLLDLLTGISDGINNNMIILGNNNPLFRQKVNAVISEWPYEDVDYEDLFHVNKRNSFNYEDILSCNNDIINLGKQMNKLQPYIKKNDGSLYGRIKDLQSNCVSCREKINNCIRNLDYISESYEPKYSKILLDLSTKQKPYYMKDIDSNDDLIGASNQSSYEEIPDNVSNMISNSVHIPNMISKETGYMKEVMGKLKDNVDDKEKTLQSVLNNTPERKIENNEPTKFTDFIYGLMTDENNEDEDEEQESKIISSPREDSKTFHIKPEGEYIVEDFDEDEDKDLEEQLESPEPEEEDQDSENEEEEDQDFENEEEEEEKDEGEDEDSDPENEDKSESEEEDKEEEESEAESEEAMKSLSGGSRGYRLSFF